MMLLRNHRKIIDLGVHEDHVVPDRTMNTKSVNEPEGEESARVRIFARLFEQVVNLTGRIIIADLLQTAAVLKLCVLITTPSRFGRSAAHDGSWWHPCASEITFFRDLLKINGFWVQGVMIICKAFGLRYGYHWPR